MQTFLLYNTCNEHAIKCLLHSTYGPNQNDSGVQMPNEIAEHQTNMLLTIFRALEEGRGSGIQDIIVHWYSVD